MKKGKMCANCETEHAKRCVEISKLPIGSMKGGEKLLDDLKCLSRVIAEVCDVGLAWILTMVYEDLVSHCVEFINGHDESVRGEIEAELKGVSSMFLEFKEKMEKVSLKYWDLVKKLAKCEKERDEECRAREQAEYDKEYFAKELAESR